jgi:hypothetical protein
MVYKKSYRAAAATRRLIKNLTAPLPRWFSKNVPNFTAAPVLDQKYWY